MTTNQETKYTASVRKFWAIYTAIIVCVITFMVLAVAEDNEERLFYSVMIAGFAYVFRPEARFIESAVKRMFGAEPPPRDNTDD